MNYKKRQQKLIKIAMLVVCFAVANVHSEVVVVVAADTPINNLSKSQISKIFLGKNRRFPNGTRALPLNQSEGTVQRNTFYRLFSGKSPAQIKAHWSKLIFTGRGQPPKEASDNEAVKYLLVNNGVNIGYIDRRAVDDSVKIVAIN